MRPVPRTSHALRSGRLPGKWLPALLIAVAAALLAPGIMWATASHDSQPSQATQASLVSAASPVNATSPAGATAGSCKGITPATFPAQGFITGPAHIQGGHMWWRSMGSAGVCIGTVVEQVWYTTTATKIWKVTIFSARHPRGQVAARATFTLRRGFYFWTFRIRHAFTGLSAVCLTADSSFGTSCVHFG